MVFVIIDPLQPVATMLQYRLYGGGHLPTNLEGLLKASANIGSVVGQFAFGTSSLIFPSYFFLNLVRLCRRRPGSQGSLYVSISPDRFIHVLILFGTWTRLDGKELMLIILATILTMTTPTGSLSPSGSLIYLSMFRILLGVGVGGDYPMSATVTSDRSNLRKRGTMLAYIFSNQGWGSFFGSLATIVVLACYKSVMEAGKTSKVDGGKVSAL